jgi:hypothetical protein
MWVLLACGMPASAEIYQWVDGAGRVHYGDSAARATQPGRPAEKIDIQETGTKVDPEAERNRQQLRTMHDLHNQQRAAQAQNAEQLAQQQQRQQQNCNSLRDNIRFERETGIMFSYDEAGNRVIWSSEQRLAYREQLQVANQQYCGATD